MKLSYNWLKEFVDFDCSPTELAKMLTFQGLETCALEQNAAAWTKVITAKVLERDKHPQADKLSLCKVSDGTNNYSIVCGAPNVAAGQTIPLAVLGAELPGGLKIKRAKIRGVESEGMICSAAELGMATESAGIMVLPEGTPLGRPLEAVLGDGDALMEVEITTNRGDCLSHWGVAREIGAKLNKPVRLPEIKKCDVPGDVKIDIQAPDLCTRYTGFRITGVKVGPSPEWLAKRLEKAGLRPINNIVDITNYVLIELGHPLHAFDVARLQGQELVVRRAAEGEKILALDGREYALTGEMLVIADGQKPAAIAGVMGGESTGVTGTTTDIILESALFAASSVRRTAKKLNISTDASYRFERGTAWEVAELAGWRAANLVVELAGGTIVGRTDRFEKAYMPVTVDLRQERVERLLGFSIPKEEIGAILTALGMKYTESNGTFSTVIPSWRLDIKMEADLIEELVRIKGFEFVPVTVQPIIPNLHEGKAKGDLAALLRDRFTSLGFFEALNYSFLEEKDLARFQLPVTHRIANPLSKENEVLRTNLLPGLWKNLLWNKSQGYDDVQLFEIGNIFTPDGEKKSLGFIACGQVWNDWWKWEGKDVAKTFDFYFLNGIVGYLNDSFRIVENKNVAPYYHPGKTACIELNGRIVGTFGMLRPDYTADLEIEAGYCELDLAALGELWQWEPNQYKQLRRYPPVKRDLSLLADKNVPFEKIYEVFNSYVKKDTLLRDFELFSQYTDESKLGAGKVSYSLHLVFRHAEHTLTDTEINGQVEKIIGRLKHELGVTLR